MRMPMLILKTYILISALLFHGMLAYLFILHPQLLNKLLEFTPLYSTAESRAASDLINYLVSNRQISAELSVKPPKEQPPTGDDIMDQINQLFYPWQPDDERFPPLDGIWLNGQRYDGLKQAIAQLDNGDTLKVGAGTYTDAFVIKRDNITIIGHGHVIFEKSAADGKGFIVANGAKLTLKNIECRHIAVASRNGACIRLQGPGLKLDNVYFHSSEEGILETAKTVGDVEISKSRFERLGKGGQAHAIYLNSANLHMQYSLVLAAKDEGHEIKSRGAKTLIEDSIIASLNSDDSRLIDIPNGGQLIIQRSILQQGPYSVNHQAIGYGLEGIKHQQNQVVIQQNLFIMDRQGSNLLFYSRNNDFSSLISGNIIIGADKEWPANHQFKNRSDANITAAPFFPPLMCTYGQRC